MKNYCTRLALGAGDCQAGSLLGVERHASFFTRRSTGEQEKEVR
jgi:hypothetical protein